MQHTRQLHSTYLSGKDVILEEMHILATGQLFMANIGKNTLIGMNAVIMDDANIGDECIIGFMFSKEKWKYQIERL